jgi:hypothetical protein
MKGKAWLEAPSVLGVLVLEILLAKELPAVFGGCNADGSHKVMP